MTFTLAVTQRDNSQTLDALRVGGGVPAVVYGPKQEPIQVTVSAKDFEKIRKEAGESTIIELSGLDSMIEVLVKDVEFNPVKQQVLHVDFYAIERGKEMSANVPLHFVGVSPAEEARLGTVTKVLHEVEVTCRPSVLPSHIDVDVSLLKDIEDKIHVSDLVVAQGVTIELEGTEPVAVISPAQTQTADESAGDDAAASEVK